MHVQRLAMNVAFGLSLIAGATGAVQFGKDDQIGESSEVITAQFSVKTPFYEAVFDRRGQIAELWRTDSNRVRQVQLTGRIKLPDGWWGPKRPVQVEMVSMTQADPRTLEVLYATHTRAVDRATQQVTKEDNLPDAYKVRYTFDDREVKVHVENKPPMNMGFEVGDRAQVAENLNDARTMGLPPLEGERLGVLRSIRLTYLDGTELLFNWQGPGNPLNVAENGGLSAARAPHDWTAARGVTEHGKYDFTFRVVPPAKPGLMVLVAPKFAIVPDSPGGIYFTGETPGMRLTFAREEIDHRVSLLDGRKLEGTRLEYEVTDQCTNVVDKGSVPIDFQADRDADGKIEKKIALKPGRLGYFTARFIVRDSRNTLRALWKERPFSVVAPLGEAAAERAKWLQPDGLFARGNVYWRNAFIGFGLVREQFNAAEVYDFQKAELTTNGIAKLDQFFKDKNRLSKETGQPFHTMFGDAQFAKTPQDAYRFYKAVLERYGKECRHWETLNEPNIVMKPQEYMELYLKPLKLAAREVAPEIVIMGPSGCGPSIDFIRELYREGTKDCWDAVSIHPYVAGNYDIEIQEVIQTIRSILHEYGDDRKPIFFTEGGFNWWNLGSQLRCARQNVRRLLIQDVYGIPKEQDYYYFTTAMGYHQFYVMERDATLLPQAVALRNNRVQLDGLRHARHFTFGIDWTHAAVYTNDTRQALAVWTFDCNRPLQLKSSKPPVKVVDMWGNAMADATWANGLITLPASGEPLYVHLPADATVSPVSIAPGRKLSDLALGADADASSSQEPVGQVLDGVRYKNGWRDATSRRFPDWVEISLPYASSMDRVMVYGPVPESGATYRDIDVFARTGGSNYVKVAQVRNNRSALLDLSFKSVTADRLRLEVLAGNSDSVEIQEIEIYSSGEAAGQESVNWALAANGAKASASSSWKLETEIPAAEPDRATPMNPVTSKRVKKVYEWKPAQALDGQFAPRTWPPDWAGYASTVWIDGTPGEFPDWLQVDFAGTKEIAVVVVFANNFSYWKPEDTGISDCELLVWDGRDWQKRGEIKGAKKGVLSFPLQPPIKTDKIRLVVKGSNDGQHSAVMEIQAMGPREAAQ